MLDTTTLSTLVKLHHDVLTSFSIHIDLIDEAYGHIAKHNFIKRAFEIYGESLKQNALLLNQCIVLNQTSLLKLDGVKPEYIQTALEESNSQVEYILYLLPLFIKRYDEFFTQCSDEFIITTTSYVNTYIKNSNRLLEYIQSMLLNEPIL